MNSVDWLESPTLNFRIADSSTKNYALKKMAEEIRKKEKQILLANELGHIASRRKVYFRFSFG